MIKVVFFIVGGIISLNISDWLYPDKPECLIYNLIGYSIPWLVLLLRS